MNAIELYGPCTTHSLSKFRFRLTEPDGRQFTATWLAPSGAEHELGRVMRSWSFTDHYSGHDLTYLDGSAFNVCMRRLSDRSLYKTCGHNRASFLSRLLGNAGPITHHWTTLRHNLDKDERKELGELVAAAVDSGGMSGVAEFLNDSGANRTILSRLKDTFSDLEYGTCGHFHNDCDEDGDRYRHYNGETICAECADNSDRYIRPEDNGRYYNRDDVYFHESRDGYYTYPEDSDDDDEANADDDGMLNYSANVLELRGPPFVSTPHGAFTIGVELEVEARRGDRSELVFTVMAQAASVIICKHDGSLDAGRGVELVSVPQEYCDAVKLFAGLEFPAGTRAWDGGNCGLHVHIDARAFTKLSVAKFLAFWNHRANAQLIRRVAGRHPLHDERARDYARLADTLPDQHIIQSVKSHTHGNERYRVVNTLNLKSGTATALGLAYSEQRNGKYNTLEIRVFRASLRKERLLAQIEMAAASVYFARDTSVQAVLAKDFTSWLAGNAARFPHLASFLKLTRRLVPDPKVEVLKDEPAGVDARLQQTLAVADVDEF